MFYMYRNHLSPKQFPSRWAADWGEDDKGLWQVLQVKDVRLVFRWSPLGSFYMGSPDDEKGRRSNEDYHLVRLTQGFWLADTTVTQALWQEIMGNNPSQFKGNHLPVERVSWNDVQDFIQRLNGLDDDLAFSLPTEAQWEYACRANTTGAFNFSGELSLEKANYSGEWIWAGGNKESLQKTCQVDAFDANDWGLYQMHGNVWEWCEDGKKEQLGNAAVTDPLYQSEGGDKRLRGGSWIGGGQYLRSAYRSAGAADSRSSIIGFRLLGQ